MSLSNRKDLRKFLQDKTSRKNQSSVSALVLGTDQARVIENSKEKKPKKPTQTPNLDVLSSEN